MRCFGALLKKVITLQELQTKGFDEQLEEVYYTGFLYKQGLGVSPTISSFNGKTVEKLTHSNHEFLTVLYKSAPGVHVPRNQWNADILKELGGQTGKLHRLSKKFEEIHPIKYINDWYDSEEYDFLKFLKKNLLSEILQKRFYQL